MFWKKSGKTSRKVRDAIQDLKMAESQRVLLNAATETANAAQAVTTILKARLDDSLKQFETTARIITDALIVCDYDGKIQTSNPAARYMFERQGLVDNSILDLFDLDGQPVTSSESLWAMIEHSTRWQIGSAAPLRGRKEDGSLFWVDPGCAKLEWSDGTMSMLVLIRNVDPFVMLHKSAHEARHRFDSVLDISFDAILIEQDDKIVAANRAVGRMFGYTNTELLTKPITMLFLDCDHKLVEADEEHAHITVHGLHSSGSMRSLLFAATFISWHGQPARLITVKDVTEMRNDPLSPPSSS